MLCGLGRAGTIHFNSIRKNHRCNLKYIVDVRLEHVQKVVSTFNMDAVQAIAPESYEKALSDVEVQAVVITTPTHTHMDYVKKALAAGKAVFCEKPLAPSIEETAALYDEAERRGRPLYCAFQRRFDPSFTKVRSEVLEGKVGTVYTISSVSRDCPFPPLEYFKTSGGIYHDCGVHDIDFICWTLGEEPIGVFAKGIARRKEIGAMGDLDIAMIVLTFPSGALGQIELNRHAVYGYDQRVEVQGSDGMVTCENPHSDNVHLYREEGYSGSPFQFSFPIRYEVAYGNEMDHFIDVVLDPSKKLHVGKRDTLLASRVADACERSQKLGRMVSLEPLAPEHAMVNSVDN